MFKSNRFRLSFRLLLTGILYRLFKRDLRERKKDSCMKGRILFAEYKSWRYITILCYLCLIGGSVFCVKLNSHVLCRETVFLS